MIPDLEFICNCAEDHGRCVPEDLARWFLAHFEDEPYPDFCSAQDLENVILMYCDSYAQGKLDVRIPSRYKRLKERYDDLKCLVMELRSDIEYLEKENAHYQELLKQHDLL